MENSVNTVSSIYPLLVFAVPLAFGIIILLCCRKHWITCEGMAFLGLSATFIISILVTQEILQGKVLLGWGFNFYVDGLSALMELLGSLMGFIILFYAPSFLAGIEKSGKIPSTKRHVFYGLLLVFLAMLNWTCATNNMVMLYVAMEATTLATTFLVTYYWNREALEAGYKYLILVTVGIIFALFGLVLIYSASTPYLTESKTLLLTELGKISRNIPSNIVLLASAFLIAGFGTKAGLVPFHAWLPDAHAEAPSPVSALLSGIVIKVGAYALARTITMFAPHYNAIVVFIAILASASMLIAMLLALVQDDIKRMLAYSSISQIAYVVEGLGLGTYLGIYGGMFHLVNHSIVKALLFLSAGAVMHSTGRRKLSELSGLGKKMPVTALCFIIGALAISGLPPFNGFMSKLTLFIAVAERKLLWAAIIAILTGFLAVACFVSASYKLFWGEQREDLTEVKEVPTSMLLSMLALCFLCILLGVYPQVIYPLMDSATKCILQIFQVGA